MAFIINPYIFGAGGYVPAGAISLDDSEYLHATYSSAGNRKTWTYSLWIKRNQTNVINYGAYAAGGPNASAYMLTTANNGDTFRFVGSDGTGGNNRIRVSANSDGTLLDTTAQYQDDSAWYHIIFVFNSTESSAGDRIKLYVNGKFDNSYGLSNPTYIGLNEDWEINSNVLHRIGKANTADYLYSTISEVILLDGYAASATDLGEYNDDNIWVPINPSTIVSAQKGTNGFWLDFADTSALGNDVSGNNNDYTLSGVDATNSTKDRPVEDDDNDLGNYCTWDKNHHNTNAGGDSAGGILYEGNLKLTNSGNNIIFGTQGFSSGKFYAEFKIIGSSSFAGSRSPFGIIDINEQEVASGSSMLNTSSTSWSGLSLPDAQSWSDGSDLGSGHSYSNFSANQIACCAVDLDNGKMWFRVNDGAWLNKTSGTGNPANGDHPTLSFTTGDTFTWCTFSYDSSDITLTDFGQNGFTYTAPDGFKTTRTGNLPEPDISKAADYFVPIGYTGNATDDRAIAVGFQPDFTLIKNRDQTDQWRVIDSLRGATKNLAIKAAAENTESDGLKAFTATGFTLGTGANGYNDNTEKFISYNWLAGGAPTADNSGSAGGAPTSGSVMVNGSANTDNLAGSKAALRISANTTSGFSIVRWDSAANEAVTIDHKLGKVPKMYWVKTVDQDYGWYVYHAGNGNTKYQLLTGENAAVDTANYWNNATPTTTVFSVTSAGGTEGVNHTGKDFIAYLWADVEGFSKFGSYKGNGNAYGPFIYLGFKPAIFIIKRADSTGAWQVYDNVRDPRNPADYRIWLEADSANASNGEGTLDFYSNGVKPRNTQTWFNASGGTFVYAAWAHTPFASNNRAR
jgi:hypothetical protein|tara:strand:- start:36 stop:2588 length:2553 start_codon:yes stop_codon:yes gene_type:complete